MTRSLVNNGLTPVLFAFRSLSLLPPGGLYISAHYFPQLYSQALKKDPDLLSGVKLILESRNYPKDDEVIKRLQDIPLYGSGDRAVKAKLILESIEDLYGHKEQVNFDDLSIEQCYAADLI